MHDGARRAKPVNVRDLNKHESCNIFPHLLINKHCLFKQNYANQVQAKLASEVFDIPGL